MRGERQSKLWESLFTTPAEWLDYRHTKKSPAYPDFRHRSTKQPLWLNSPHKPSWVDSTLARSEYLHKVDTSLLCHLSQCGSLEYALHTLYCLPTQSVFSWRSIISGYVEYGHNLEALRMHTYMRECGFEPDGYVFVSLLKACGNLRDCQEGRKLHCDSIEKGISSDIYVGSTLISMYGKCGNIAETESVFRDLSSRNVVSWNAMLSVYVDHNLGVKALLLYRQMQEEGEKPNELTYMASLQACTIISPNKGKKDFFAYKEMEEEFELNFEASLCIGRALHSDVRKKNLDSEPYIGNTLVMMYGKHGILAEAKNVFYILSRCNIITWNTILLAHVEHGQGRMALMLHKLMYEENVSPDGHTFAISLQACSNLVEEEDVVIGVKSSKLIAREIGLALHADVERKVFSEDAFVVSTLVNLYGKCGMVEEAENIFRELIERDVVAWTAMLLAYVEKGLGCKALLAYRQMQEEGINMDQYALVIALQACGTLAETHECINSQECLTSVVAGDIGHALHSDARRKGYTFHSHVCNSLISMYGKCGKLMEAQHVLNGLALRNVVSWNAMLSSFVEQGQPVKSLQLYQHIVAENVVPDDLTYIILLQACGRFAEDDEAIIEGQSVKSASLAIGEALHVDALRRGLILGAFVYNTLVNMYIKSGSLAKALEVLNDSPQNGCSAWNSVLSAFVDQGNGECALHIYERMHKYGVSFSPSALVSALQACGDTSCLEICRQLHFGIVSTGYEVNLMIANTLIHAYGSSGSLEDGQEVLDGLLDPDLVSWNAYLSGCARQGKNSECLEKMRETGIDPNGVTFLSLLSACSHGGDIYTGIEYLECMHRDHSLTPEVNHHAVMVDLLGRAGNFKQVEDLLGRIQTCVDLSIWLRLLGSCRTHSNAELGRWAFDHAMQLHPERTTLYVWMSNIYAAIAVEDGECEVKSIKMDDVSMPHLVCNIVPPNQCLYDLFCETEVINGEKVCCVH